MMAVEVADAALRMGQQTLEEELDGDHCGLAEENVALWWKTAQLWEENAILQEQSMQQWQMIHAHAAMAMHCEAMAYSMVAGDWWEQGDMQKKKTRKKSKVWGFLEKSGRETPMTMTPVSSNASSAHSADSDSACPVAPPGLEDVEIPTVRGGAASTATTMMMRNIPNQYRREMLIDLLEANGFKGLFDMLYVPMDFQSQNGLGYAFVNFRHADDADRFRTTFTGFDDWAMASEKVCDVSASGAQGLDNHVERYRNSPVMHSSVPDRFKPALFSPDGERMPFPVPTKNIRPPRLWSRPNHSVQATSESC